MWNDVPEGDDELIPLEHPQIESVIFILEIPNSYSPLSRIPTVSAPRSASPTSTSSRTTSTSRSRRIEHLRQRSSSSFQTHALHRDGAFIFRSRRAEISIRDM